MSPDLAAWVKSIVDPLVNRIRTLEADDRSEVTGGVQSMLFAAIPVAGQPGRLLFVSNGRKVGEGAGAGTGVLCYDDGVAWRTCDTSTTVLV